MLPCHPLGFYSSEVPGRWKPWRRVSDGLPPIRGSSVPSHKMPRRAETTVYPQGWYSNGFGASDEFCEAQPETQVLSDNTCLVEESAESRDSGIGEAGPELLKLPVKDLGIGRPLADPPARRRAGGSGGGRPARSSPPDDRCVSHPCLPNHPP